MKFDADHRRQTSIRLWEDSGAALIHAGARKAEPVEYTSKARILADDLVAHCDQPRTLQRIYFLGTGSADVTRIEPVSPSEAFVELVKHSFLLDIEARDMLMHHFGQLTDLVKTLRFFTLDYPRRYDVLGTVREAIIQHARVECTPTVSQADRAHILPTQKRPYRQPALITYGAMRQGRGNHLHHPVIVQIGHRGG